MNKKKLLIPIAACAVLLFASCDMKKCYCYDITSQGVIEQEEYTNSDTPCSALGNSNRGCVEEHERMNPNDIAWK